MHISSFIMGTCSVIGCKNQRGKTLLNKKFGITFHLFPKDPERRYKWVRAIKRENFNPSEWSTICSQHFLPTDFKDDEFGYLHRNLKNDTVPSVFPTLATKLQKGSRSSGGKERQIGVEDTPPVLLSNYSNKSSKVNMRFFCDFL